MLENIAEILTILFLGATIIYAIISFVRSIWPRIRALFTSRVTLSGIAMMLAVVVLAFGIVTLTIQVVSTVSEVTNMNKRLDKFDNVVGVLGKQVGSLNKRLSDLGHSETQEYTWRKGDPEKEMLSVSEGVCYLTRVQGKFEGHGEAVFVTIKGNSWYLHGRANQPLLAKARCWKFPSPLKNQ